MKETTGTGGLDGAPGRRFLQLELPSPDKQEPLPPEPPSRRDSTCHTRHAVPDAWACIDHARNSGARRGSTKATHSDHRRGGEKRRPRCRPAFDMSLGPVDPEAKAMWTTHSQPWQPVNEVRSRSRNARHRIGVGRTSQSRRRLSGPNVQPCLLSRRRPHYDCGNDSQRCAPT